jgi:hypothetical protein
VSVTTLGLSRLLELCPISRYDRLKVRAGGDCMSLYSRWSSGKLSPDDWLWCLHCERFFQVKDMRPDDVCGKQGCAFEDCDGAGLGVDIYDWDDWAKQNDLKHWPESTGALHKGMRCPLYP